MKSEGNIRMLLQDKVVIVTGIGPGMGRKLALEAGKAGAKLVLAARSTDFVESVAREVGDRAIAVTADVSKHEDCDRIAAAAIERFGRIDGLVNSAYGAAPFIAFEDGDLADWRRSMDITVFGTLQMVKSVLPHMKAAGGSIVNVSTMETRKTLPGHGAYVVPKVALSGVTRQLAVELGKYRIRVNTAVMGWMWGTPVENYIGHMAAAAGQSVADFKAGVAANIALGHIPPDQDCAKAILLLLSDYAGEITGASLDINGGEFMPQ
jgi:NAD(P)-dependent dehydrogenase (short-subunit alcohol dehydrogenase family)